MCATQAGVILESEVGGFEVDSIELFKNLRRGISWHFAIVVLWYLSVKLSLCAC